MSKGDQIIEEKALCFKTISNSHIHEVANFIVEHYPGFEEADN